MPQKSLHFCNFHGCNRLTKDRYCPEHMQMYEDKRKSDGARYDKKRGNAQDRGYDWQWMKARDAYLRKNPLCERCIEEGKVVPAVLAHHRMPLSENGARLDPNNLQALCVACHEEVHKNDRWGRKPKEEI